ncbi:glycosyl transferase [Croceicoccus ponticola]|uniref:Glycosyl transferase n=1 Tax=Croceicoccus ponticola TaxID=2217664 RepID=A0A437H0F7_9SPHN|nr:glycosyl transferase [Croceicoccus ponticola]RVQ69023.1 glycosyl transferase [Croceicoccus ponticola]
MRLNVVAIGGKHQLPHFIPLVMKLHERGLVKPKIFVPDREHREFIEMLATRLKLPVPPIVIMKLPYAIERWVRGKRFRLLWWARKLRDADALLSAERTSTILTRLPGKCPRFLHIPHGAGDGAKGFEPRLKRFDEILTAGEKDRQRVVMMGLCPDTRVHAVGGVKVATLTSTVEPERRFSNSLPTVFYNPHFSERLGTFHQVADRLIDEIERDPRYNLVLAPHIRLAEKLDAAVRKRMESRSCERVIVDFGSDLSCDMTYARTSDLYIGDVSSQVYEFIMRPRPCLFLRQGDTDWLGNPDYAMWKFGPVIGLDAPLIPAIDDAIRTFPAYRAEQETGSAHAFAGDRLAPDQLDKIAIAVESILANVTQPSGR